MHRLWGTWLGYAFFAGVPTAVFIGAFFLGWDLSRPGVFDLPGWAVLCASYVFIFVFMPLQRLLLLWLSGRRNRTLSGVQTQTIGPAGFSASGPAFSTNLKWEAIYKAIETKHFFLVYISSRAAYFIPKARISTAVDLAKLRSVLIAHLDGKAKLYATL
jgi:hypothetical protein